MKPDYANLFKMTDPLATRPWRLSVKEDSRWKKMVEEAWKASHPSQDPPSSVVAFHKWVMGLIRGEAKADPPLYLVPAMGGYPTHVMWASPTGILVVSQRVVDLLREHNLTGWATYAVEVRDKQGNLVPDYYGFAITGRAGRQDLYRGKIINKPPKVSGGKPYQVLKGFFFEDDFWDGSDFCLAGVAGPIIVTKRVVRLFKQHRIRNVEFTSLLEVEEDIQTLAIVGVWPPPGQE